MNNFILDSRTSQNISFQDQSNSQEYEINDLMKIKKISNKLQQLCFYVKYSTGAGTSERTEGTGIAKGSSFKCIRKYDL